MSYNAPLPPLPPLPPAPPKQKNWFARHKIMTGLGALVLVGAIGAATDGGSSDKTTTVDSAASATTTPKATPKATPKPTPVPGNTTIDYCQDVLVPLMEYNDVLSDITAASRVGGAGDPDYFFDKMPGWVKRLRPIVSDIEDIEAGPAVSKRAENAVDDISSGLGQYYRVMDTDSRSLQMIEVLTDIQNEITSSIEDLQKACTAAA